MVMTNGFAALSTDIGAPYVQTIVTLTAQQAAGAAPLIAANPKRMALQVGAAVHFKVSLVAGATDGQRIYAGARDELAGKSCPLGALYHVPGSGLVTGDKLVMWEAQA